MDNIKQNELKIDEKVKNEVEEILYECLKYYFTKEVTNTY